MRDKKRRNKEGDRRRRIKEKMKMNEIKLRK